MKKFMLMGLVLFVSMIVYTGCKKDKDEATNIVQNLPTSAVDMLTGGSIRKWGLVSQVSNGQSQTLDSCMIAGRLIFTKIGSKYAMEGNCHAADEYGTWTLSNSDKLLTLNTQYYIEGSDTTSNTDQYALDVITLSNTQLTVRNIDAGDTLVSTFNVAN